MTDRPRSSILNQTSRLRFVASARAFATSSDGPAAGRFLLMLLALLFAINTLNVVSSYVGRDFMTAVANRDPGDFAAQTMRFIAVLAACTLVAVIYRYVEERLGLLWRGFLTNRLVDLYLRRGFYHHLDAARIANPDQRIADDVKAFTSTTLSFLLLILNAVLSGFAFAAVMLSISPLLFGVAVTYAGIGTAATVWFGRPLVWINYDQFDREAELRADLLQLRGHSELVALAHHETIFHDRLGKRLRALVKNYRRLIAVNRNLNLFTTGYNYYIQVIPVLVVAPMYMRGEVEFGVITQASVAFAQLLGAFSLIVTQFQSISSFTAVVARLDDFSEAAQESDTAAPPPIEVVEQGELLRFEHLTLEAPEDGRVLVEDLTLVVERHKRLLVSGPSDSAKMALFRATADLWDHGRGRIVRPGGRCMCFVPERPYLPPGTLRDTLASPDCMTLPTDERIGVFLHELGLDETVARVGGLDVERDWDDILSLGELQRLAMARVLMIAPDFAMFDRIESTLEPECLHTVHSLLDSVGVTYVTIGRGDSDLPHYDKVLELSGSGPWSLQDVAKYEAVTVTGTFSVNPS